MRGHAVSGSTWGAYRGALYDSYASRLKGGSIRFDASGARRWGRSYGWFLRSWLPVSRDAAITDVGCGAGWMLAYLKQCGYRNLSGVDISREQVDISRQVIDAVEEGDATGYLEARAEQFDLILALDLLEHLSKEEGVRFLEACFGALRARGRLVIQTPNPESSRAGGIIFGDATHEQAVGPSALAGLLRFCGFKEIRMREAGPAPHGVASACRWLAWQWVRLGRALVDTIETGGPGNCICTRVYFGTGLKGTS